MKIIAFLFLALSVTQLSAHDLLSDLLTVGDPGNQPDKTFIEGAATYGAVPHAFSIEKYDVTATQYCEFLNAVASTSDTHHLYDPRMSSDKAVATIICTSETNGITTYTPMSDRGNFPITYVTLYSAMRFCNWLVNKKQTFEENNQVTENGAYELNGAMSGRFASGPAATWFLPTEDEWYKAAYYVAGGTDSCYWAFPNRSSWAPENSLYGYWWSKNEANYYRGGYTVSGNFHLTQVGAFSNSVSPYGAYDMGGNVAQWTTTLEDPTSRTTKYVARGGSWKSVYNYFKAGINNDLESSARLAFDPTQGYNTIGFRVASSLVGSNVTLSLDTAPGDGELTPTEIGSVAAGVTAVIAGIAGLRMSGLCNGDDFYKENDCDSDDSDSCHSTNIFSEDEGLSSTRLKEKKLTQNNPVKMQSYGDGVFHNIPRSSSEIEISVQLQKLAKKLLNQEIELRKIIKNSSEKIIEQERINAEKISLTVRRDYVNAITEGISKLSVESDSVKSTYYEGLRKERYKQSLLEQKNLERHLAVVKQFLENQLDCEDSRSMQENLSNIQGDILSNIQRDIAFWQHINLLNKIEVKCKSLTVDEDREPEQQMKIIKSKAYHVDRAYARLITDS